MDDFTKRYDLKFKNALVFKELISQIEYPKILQEMGEIIESNSAKIDGYITTCNHGIDKIGKADMEIIFPLDKKIVLNEEFARRYKTNDIIEINNCLKVRHEGNPQMVRPKVEEMLDYIVKNGIEKQSDVYSVIIRDVTSTENIDQAIMELYVKVNK